MKKTLLVIMVIIATIIIVCACTSKSTKKEEISKNIDINNISIDLDSIDTKTLTNNSAEAEVLDKAITLTKEMEDALSAEYSAVEKAIAEADGDFDISETNISPEDGVAILGEVETNIAIGDTDGIANWMSSLFVDEDTVKSETKTLEGKKIYTVHYTVSPGDPIVFLNILQDAGLDHYVEIEAIVDTNTISLEDAIKIATIK